jgi:hypothetical protein
MSIRKATPKKRSSADRKRAIEQIETVIATERKKREKSDETFTASFSFTLRIPNGVEKTGYFGNTVLQQLSFHDVGKYLDRSVFFFGVV